jgi:hypothetical protein
VELGNLIDEYELEASEVLNIIYKRMKENWGK